MRLLAGMALVLGLSACASVDRTRADMHERSAERAARHGNFSKAAREQRKAEELNWKANRAPLP